MACMYMKWLTDMGIKIVEERGYSSEDMKKILLENNSALMKAILIMYDIQVKKKGNKRSNNVGFNRYDVPSLTNYALKIKRHNGLYTNDLNDARNRMLKYSKQLANIINNKKDKEEGVQLKWKI